MTMDDAPELSVREGYTLPTTVRGDCNMTVLADGGIRINHADPQVLISAQLLAQLYVDSNPHVTLTMGRGPNDAPFWEGALLKIEGVNRTVIYRIREYVPAVHGYVAEWPD